MPVLTIEQLTNQINTLTGVPYTRQEAIQMLAQSAVLDNNKSQGVLGQAPGFETVRTSTTPDIFGGTEEESYISRGITPTPGVDIQELRAQDQSWGDKVANGLIKATVTFGTSAAEGLIGLPVGVVQGLYNLADADPNTGFMSGLSNNMAGNAIDSVNDAAREALPNYYTKAEQEAGLLGRVGTVNFWADKFMNGAGYLAGAYASGLGLNKFMQLSKLGLADDAAREIARLKPLADSGDLAAIQKLGEVSKSLKITDGVRQAALGTVMAHAESSVEARETLRTLRDQMYQLREKGDGVYAKMTDQEIEEAAVSGANANYLLNMAVVGGSNFWMLGKTLLPSYKTTLDNVRKAEVSLASEMMGGPVLNPGIAVKATAKELGKYAKPLELFKGFGQGALVEGSQEGLQFAGQKGAEEYFLKKYNPEAKFEFTEYINGLLKGVEETVTTTDGLESMLLGALLGGPVSAAQARGEMVANEARDKKLAGLLNLAQTSLTGITRTVDNAVLNFALENEMVEAAGENDIFKYKNLEFDRFKTWVRSVADLGGIDLLVQRLEMTKDLSNEEFAKFFGYEGTGPMLEIDSNFVNSREAIVNKAIQQVKKIGQVSADINFKFGDKSQAIKDAIFDAATNFENIDVRNKELTKRVFDLTDGQIDYNTIKKTNLGDYKEVLAKKLRVWMHETTPDKFDEANELLKDLEKLDARREKFIKQYREASNEDSKFNLLDRLAKDELKLMSEFQGAEKAEFDSIVADNTSVDPELGFQSAEFELEVEDENEGKTIVKIDEGNKIGEYIVDPESLNDIKTAKDSRKYLHLKDKEGKPIFKNGLLIEEADGTKTNKFLGSEVVQPTKKTKVKFNEQGELVDAQGNVLADKFKYLEQLKELQPKKSVQQVKQELVNKARINALKSIIEENTKTIEGKQDKLATIEEKLAKVTKLLEEAKVKGQTKKKLVEVNPEKPFKSLVELEQIRLELEKEANELSNSIDNLTEYTDRLKVEIEENKDFNREDFQADLNKYTGLKAKYETLLGKYNRGIKAVKKAITELKALIVKFYPNFESTFQELMSNFNLDAPTDFANASLINNVLGNLNKRLFLLEERYEQLTKNIENVQKELNEISPIYNELTKENNLYKSELSKLLASQVKATAKTTTSTNEVNTEVNNKEYDRDWESAKPDVVKLGNKTAGKHVNKDGSLNSNASQVRFFEAVSKLNPNTGDYELRLVTPATNPELYTEEDLANHSEANPNIKAIVLLDGEPINSNLEKMGKNPTKELIASEGIYTSLPLATLTTEEFDNKFTNKQNKTEEEIEEIRANYEKWRNEQVKLINSGADVKVTVTGKGKGVLNKERGVFKSVWSALGLTSEFFKNMEVQIGNKNIPNTIPGLVYITTPEGNLIPLYNRNLTSNEVDIVVNALKALGNGVESIDIDVKGKVTKTKKVRKYLPFGKYKLGRQYNKFLNKIISVSKDKKTGKFYYTEYEKKSTSTVVAAKIAIKDILDNMVFFSSVASLVKKAEAGKEDPYAIVMSQGKLYFGETEVDLDNIESVEKELRDFLATKNLNISKDALGKDGKYYEVTAIDENGNANVKEHSSYKHYLFNDEKGKRPVEEIPLTTDVVSKDSGKPQVMSSYLEFKGATKIEKPGETKIPENKEEKTEEEEISDTDEFEDFDPDEAIFKGSAETNPLLNRVSTENAFINSETTEPDTATPNIFDVEEPSTTTTEETNLSEKVDESFPFKLKKSSQYVKGDIEAATKWLNEKLGIPVEKVPGLIEGKAFGQFINNIIRLSTELEVGTEYHEAFHAVFRMFLTPKERERIYEEAKEKYDAPTKKDLDNLNNIYPQLNGNVELLTKLYYEEKLADSFQDYVLSKNNASKEANKIIDNSFTGKIKAFFQKLWNAITNVKNRDNKIDELFDRIESGYFKGRTPIGTSNPMSVYKTLPGLNQLTSVSDTKAIMDNLFYQFVERLTKGAKTIEEIEYNIDNSVKSAIINEELNKISKQLKKAGRNDLVDYLDKHKAVVINYFRNDYLNQFNITLEETIEEKEYTEKALGNNNTRDIAYDLNASKINPRETTSNFIKLLLAATPAVDKNGNVVISPEYGMVELEDYQKLFNFISYHLNGITTFEGMMSKLERLKKIKPSINKLLERVDVGTNASNLRMKVLFQQAFSKTKLNYQIMRITREGNIVFNDPNFEQLKNVRIEKWLSDFKSRGSYTLGGQTFKVVTKNKLGFPDVNSAEFIRLYNFVNANYTNVKLKDRANLILKSIGFEFSNPQMPLTEEEIKQLEKALHNIYLSISQGNSFLEMFKLEERGNIVNIVNIELNSTEELSELSHIGPDGETRYGITQNNLFTLISNAINRVSSLGELEASYPHLFNIYNKESFLLRKGGLLFDSSGKRNKTPFEISILEGIEAENANGEVTDALKFPDKILLHLNSVLKGLYPMIRTADKTLEYGIQTQAQDSAGSYKSAPIISKETSKNSQELFDKFFIGYIQDELNRYKQLSLNKVGNNVQYYNKNVMTNPFTLTSPIVQGTAIETNKDSINNLKDYLNENPEVYQQLIINLDSYLNNLSTSYANLLLNNQVTEGINQDFLSANNLNVKKDLNEIARIYIANSLVMNIEQHKIFFGDPAFYKSMEDEFKRTAGPAGTKKIAFVDDYINRALARLYKRKDGKTGKDRNFVKSITLEDITVKSKYFNELQKALIEAYGKDKGSKLAEAYNNINEADAQGYITLDEYRDFLARTGEWTHKHDKAYEKAIKGEELSSDELFYFNPLKAQYFGPQNYEMKGSRLFIPTYQKYSLMPLIPSVIKGTNLEKLYESMVSTQTGIAVFGSGKKVGALLQENGNLFNLYNEQGQANPLNNDLTFSQLDYRFLGIQVDIAPKVKDKTVFGTQFRRIVASFFSGGVSNPLSIINFGKDGEVTGLNTPSVEEASKLKDLHNEFISKIIDKRIETLTKELGFEMLNGKYVIKDLNRVVEALKAQATQRQSPDNIIEAIDSLKLSDSARVNIESLPSRNKLEQILFALINNDVITHKVNGSQRIQAASTGFESMREYDAETGKILSSPELRFYTRGLFGETLPAQVMIALPKKLIAYAESIGGLDVLNAKLKQLWELEYDAEGKVIGGARYNPERIKEIGLDPRIFTLIGYRIPTQGYNSLEQFEIAGFLPSIAGETVVVPSEITAKSGSDFDIDKLFLLEPNYEIIDRTEYNYNVENLYNYLHSSVENSDAKPHIIKAALRILRLTQKDTTKQFNKILSLADNSSLDNPLIALAKFLNQYSVTSGKGFLGNLTPKEVTDNFEAYKLIKDSLVKYNNSASVKKDKIKVVEEIIYSESETEEGWMNKIIENSRKILSAPEIYIDLITPNDVSTLKGLSNELKKISEANGEQVESKASYSVIEPEFILNMGNNFLVGKAGVGISALQLVNHLTAQIADLKVNKPLYFKGEGYSSLGSEMDSKKINKIANIISEFINGYVDVARDPFIFTIGASTQVADVFFYLIRRGVGIDTIVYFMNQPIIKDYIKRQAVNESLFNKSLNREVYKPQLIKKILEEYTKAANNKSTKQEATQRSSDYEYSSSLLKQYLYKENKNSEAFYLDQIKIFNDFISYQEEAKDLSRMIRNTVPDTNTNKNFNSALLMSFESERFLQEKTGASKEGELRFINFNKMYEDTFLKHFRTGQQYAKNIYQDLYKIGQNPVFVISKTKILEILYRQDTRASKDDIQRILDTYDSDFITYLLLTKPIGKQSSLSNYYKALLTGNTSLANRIINELKPVSEGGKGNTRLKGNLLVKELYYVLNNIKTNNALDTVSFINKRLDTYSTNLVISAFNELLQQSPNTTGYNIAKDLIFTAIMQSGISQSPISFLDKVPYQYYKGFAKQILDTYNFSAPDIFNFTEQFFLNNYQNDQLVPKVNLYDNFTGEPLPITTEVSLYQGSRGFTYPFVKRWKWNTDNMSDAQIKEKRLRGEQLGSWVVYKQLEMFDKDAIVRNYKAVNTQGAGIYLKEYYPNMTESFLPNNLTKNKSLIGDKVKDSTPSEITVTKTTTQPSTSVKPKGLPAINRTDKKCD